MSAEAGIVIQESRLPPVFTARPNGPVCLYGSERLRGRVFAAAGRRLSLSKMHRLSSPDRGSEYFFLWNEPVRVNYA